MAPWYSKKLIKFLAIPAIVFILIVGAIGYMSYELDKSMSRPLIIAEAKVFKVVRGDSLKSIAHELASKGWIAHPYYFIYEARVNGQAQKLQMGEYRIEQGDSARDVLEKMVTGKVIQYAFTIVEGWNFQQITQAMRNDPVLIQTLDTTDPASIMSQLGYQSLTAEGRFFPDTYHFPSNTTDMEFLSRAYERMEEVLGEEWQRRDLTLPYKSPDEALVMASIIEKETAVADEREEIAGVFVRRLEKNMLLQTDPTVIYALGEDYDGDIRKKDLSIDSPYNTYRYRGLPPTPIASPGRAAIHAALHPESGSALYFVAMGDGRHYFSDTLDEHNKAVAQYQLKK